MQFSCLGFHAIDELFQWSNILAFSSKKLGLTSVSNAVLIFFNAFRDFFWIPLKFLQLNDLYSLFKHFFKVLTFENCYKKKQTFWKFSRIQLNFQFSVSVINFINLNREGIHRNSYSETRFDTNSIFSKFLSNLKFWILRLILELQMFFKIISKVLFCEKNQRFRLAETSGVGLLRWDGARKSFEAVANPGAKALSSEPLINTHFLRRKKLSFYWFRKNVSNLSFKVWVGRVHCIFFKKFQAIKIWNSPKTGRKMHPNEFSIKTRWKFPAVIATNLKES